MAVRGVLGRDVRHHGERRDRALARRPEVQVTAPGRRRARRLEVDRSSPAAGRRLRTDAVGRERSCVQREVLQRRRVDRDDDAAGRDHAFVELDVDAARVAGAAVQADDRGREPHGARCEPRGELRTELPHPAGGHGHIAAEEAAEDELGDAR